MGKSFNHFHKIAATAGDNANNLLDAYQGFWLDASVQLAPEDTGDLKNSGTPEPGDGEYERKIVFTVDYAKHQEYGTVDMAAQPFLRPAKEHLRAAFKRDIKSVFGRFA